MTKPPDEKQLLSGPVLAFIVTCLGLVGLGTCVMWGGVLFMSGLLFTGLGVQLTSWAVVSLLGTVFGFRAMRTAKGN